MEWITKKNSIFPKKGVPADRKWEWERESAKSAAIVWTKTIFENSTLYFDYFAEKIVRDIHIYLE